jgi:two-component system NtrC family sensor kinase
MNQMTNIPVELYLRILDQFPNPIWRSGINAKCDFFNKEWYKFTGRTEAEEMGDGWAKGVHPDDLKTCFKTYTDAFNSRIPFSMEYRLMHSDGTYHWLLDCGSPFFDENGEFLGYIGSCYDITDAKKYTAEIESMNRMMIDRELRMVELKKEIDEMKKKISG